MPSPYSILEPVCAYTGANIHSHLPPPTNPNPHTRAPLCRRVPSAPELRTAKGVFGSTILIFLILLLPWLLLGVKFIEHPQKYYILALGVLLHLNTCLFVYTEGVAMGMMYVRSVGCSPVQEWERRSEDVERGERYRDQEVLVDIEKVAMEVEGGEVGERCGREKERGMFWNEATAHGTMHGQFGP